MPGADEAAKKIAAANLELERVRKAQAEAAKVKAAERRLYLLLRLFAEFKNDPNFKAAYQREMMRLR